MEKMDVTYTTVLGIFAEMILDESLRKHREQQLYSEIDEALKKGDAASFFALTDELKILLSTV